MCFLRSITVFWLLSIIGGPEGEFSGFAKKFWTWCLPEIKVDPPKKEPGTPGNPLGAAQVPPGSHYRLKMATISRSKANSY
jgi:hypothetical protein